MQSPSEQVLDLIDAQHRQIGRVTIVSKEDDLLIGTFVPGPAFPAVEHIFREFEAAVDSQALGVVDQIDTAIAALGLQLCSHDEAAPIQIHDVQIWSDGNITCRLRAVPLNGISRSAQPIRSAKN